MEAGSIIILIIWIAISALSGAQKKKQREQKRQSAAANPAQPAPRQTGGMPRRMQSDLFPELMNPQRTPPRDDRFPDLQPKVPTAADTVKTTAQQTVADGSEGAAIGGSLAGTDAERQALYAQIDTKVGRTPLHTVKAVTESEHAHVESSIVGIQGECAAEAPSAPEAPDSTQAYVIATGSTGPRRFAFDRASTVQGLLYSEILGKPKALRR